MKEKLAVIGTGMAGMSAAYFLRDQFDITLYEKNDYVGGHTNTIFVSDGEKECSLDTGFMVFNEETYPNLLKLFKELNVEYENTDMSFSVSNKQLGLEYNGSSLDGIFSQRKNLLNFKFLKMVKEILKFNGDALRMLEDPKSKNLTISEYLKELGLSDYFFDNFLTPMSSAVWSTPIEKIKNFPAKSLVRFFKNHGFVGINTQLQWKTVTGGSIQYRDKIIESFKDNIQIKNGAISVKEVGDKIEVKTKNGVELFDRVIIASHGDEALSLLERPTELQTEVLSKFKYQKNIATVHTDESVMPKMKKNWSSWNFIIRNNEAFTVYYMNRLQGVSELKNFFVNINGEKFIDSSKIIKSIEYHHPIFDVAAVAAQRKIDELNRIGKIHFTGSYYRYGFHEDALLSSVNLCKSILEKEVFSE